MGMEMESTNGDASGTAETGGSLETRPGILLIGSPNVGKRTILSRLLSIEIPETHDLSSGVLCQGWTIETKYYSADTSVWTANLGEDFSLASLPNGVNLAALVMVFDMSDELSFSTLRNWVSGIDIKNFDILLCIGNKADLVPGHQAHAEYRRRMQRYGESSGDPHPEYSNFGINEEEGSSLLWDEEPSIEIRKGSMDWCIENNIEYIEACASNADFDKCLSVNGDMQGMERLFGALSAHLWPGMVLKSGNRIPAPFLAEKEDSTDEESDYELEYETLSHGSGEAWHDVSDLSAPGTEEGVEYSDFVGASGASTSHSRDHLTEEAGSTENQEASNGHVSIDDTSQIDTYSTEIIHDNVDDDEHYGLDDMERLMSEIGNMRDNLRLMPDFQRREMAAKLAMRMAVMFGASSDEEV
ncbi:Ras-related protein Rab-8A [Rhynchospora pubera]|uniref:Ras-related protein Rab-8A n=1 Tax=Rhynchospora pubera TaxID=906938 RepID=A0AAV8G644_9POAL|nr:Ras-related protein Rab-8A [Rhynchospora pubera]